ncbi:MAG TPA: response regulator [Chloroflexota bacterium]|nr:response regulator [Chloroflexota bacterium]
MSPRRTVLLVEDDPDLLRFAQVTLRLGGYRPLMASDGQTAVALARKAQPSLVVLDLRLPELDGWSVLETLRAAPETAQLPVLVLTASAGPADQDRALAAGAVDYLVKPVSADALLAAIERALAGSAS